MKKVIYIIPAVILFSLSGCMRYLTHDREEVLLQGVDMDQTLLVAEDQMNERNGRIGTSLPIWVIRDQHITPSQVQKVSQLYFKHINSLEKKFDKWHLAWAVANIYRMGDDSVKIVLKSAYEDASQRAKKLEGITDRMVNGDKLYMGDAHSGGRSYAQKHIVIPGNEKYLQSYEEYRRAKEK